MYEDNIYFPLFGFSVFSKMGPEFEKKTTVVRLRFSSEITLYCLDALL